MLPAFLSQGKGEATVSWHPLEHPCSSLALLRGLGCGEVAVVQRQQFPVVAGIQAMSCCIEALFSLQTERNTGTGGNESMNWWIGQYMLFFSGY